MEQIQKRELTGSALYLLVGLLALVQIIDGMDANMLAFVGGDVSKDLGLSKTMLGACIGAAFMGQALGAVLFGFIADRFGRKSSLFLVVAMFALGSLATAFSPSGEILLALRLATGLALGGLFPVAAALLFERSPQSMRITNVTIMAVGPAAGAAVCGIATAYLLPAFGWQGLFILGGIVPLVLLPAIYLIVPPDSSTVRVEKGLDKPSTADGHFVLFEKGAWRTTLALWGALFFCAVPNFFVIGWLPTIARENGVSLSQAALAGSLFVMMGPLGGILGARGVDRFGLKIPVFMTLGGAVGMALLGYAIGQPGLAVASATAGVFIVGLVTLLAAVSGQFYANAVRALGVGCALAAMRAGATLSPWMSGALMDNGISFQTLFWGGAVCLLVSGTLLLFLTQGRVSGRSAELVEQH